MVFDESGSLASCDRLYAPQYELAEDALDVVLSTLPAEFDDCHFIREVNHFVLMVNNR